jgi:hypothetical protein
LVSPVAVKEFSRKFTIPDVLMETESKQLLNSEEKEIDSKTSGGPVQNVNTGASAGEETQSESSFPGDRYLRVAPPMRLPRYSCNYIRTRKR